MARKTIGKQPGSQTELRHIFVRRGNPRFLAGSCGLGCGSPGMEWPKAKMYGTIQYWIWRLAPLTETLFDILRFKKMGLNTLVFTAFVTDIQKPQSPLKGGEEKPGPTDPDIYSSSPFEKRGTEGISQKEILPMI